MMAKLFILFLLLFEIYNSNGQTPDPSHGDTNTLNVTQHMGNCTMVNCSALLHRIDTKLDKILDRLAEGDTFICNVTVKRVVEEVVDLRETLTEDATVKLVRPDHRSKRLSVDVPEDYYTCVQEYNDKPISRSAAQYTCLQDVLWDYQPVPDKGTRMRDEHLIKSLAATRNKRGEEAHAPLRVRKEYRALSETERQKFHDALQALFMSGVVAAFGRIHSETDYTAHKGLTFLPWHRLFIIKFEDALRQHDPSVSLPYWDCTIDTRLDRPSDSILWTDDYFGNIEGPITSGLAKNWTSSEKYLSRWCGYTAQLPSKERFEKLLQECSIKKVSIPLATANTSSFEDLHNDVHNWVGGDMSEVYTAAYDPIFYMMHAYFDLKWEEFRNHQRAHCDVDPVTDYPSDEELEMVYVDTHYFKEDSFGPTHSLDHPMDGMSEFSISDGLSDRWTRDVYTYEAVPTCENNCSNSDLLYCNTTINHCMPKTRNVPERETKNTNIENHFISGRSTRIVTAISRATRNDKGPFQMRDISSLFYDQDDEKRRI